jgi:hypothetical protein
MLHNKKYKSAPIPIAYLAKAKAVLSHSDPDDMGSIPAILDARYVPFLLCHKRFNEASLPAQKYYSAI